MPDPTIARDVLPTRHRHIGSLVHHVGKQQQRRRAISRSFGVIRRAGKGAEYVRRVNFPGARRVEQNGRLHPGDVLEIVEAPILRRRQLPGLARSGNAVGPLSRRQSPALVHLDERQMIACLEAVYQTVQERFRFVEIGFGPAA